MNKYYVVMQFYYHSGFIKVEKPLYNFVINNSFFSNWIVSSQLSYLFENYWFRDTYSGLDNVVYIEKDSFMRVILFNILEYYVSRMHRLSDKFSGDLKKSLGLSLFGNLGEIVYRATFMSGIQEIRTGRFNYDFSYKLDNGVDRLVDVKSCRYDFFDNYNLLNTLYGIDYHLITYVIDKFGNNFRIMYKTKVLGDIKC